MNHDEQIKALKETIKWFRKQIEPHDCGWMYTTIEGLQHRIRILRSEIKKNLPKESWIDGYKNIKKTMTSGKQNDVHTIKIQS